MEQTPLNGRENAYSLLGLAPGVQRPNSNALISGGSFHGGANQTIDGISNDDIVNARMSDQVPSLESAGAIQHYRCERARRIREWRRTSSYRHQIRQQRVPRQQLYLFNRNHCFHARRIFHLPPARRFRFSIGTNTVSRLEVHSCATASFSSPASKIFIA